MLFGSNRDFDLLVNINRELLKDIIEQEVLYHKLSLEDLDVNLYGEALEKTYWNAIKMYCLITRGDQVYDVQEFGIDVGREASVAFIRQDLVDSQVVPEVGDIVQWHNDFYEVDTVRENTLFLDNVKVGNAAQTTMRLAAIVEPVERLKFDIAWFIIAVS